MLKNMRTFHVSSNDYGQLKKDLKDAFVMSEGRERVEGYGPLWYTVLVNYKALRARCGEQDIGKIIRDNDVWKVEYLSPAIDRKIDGKWVTIPPQLVEINFN